MNATFDHYFICPSNFDATLAFYSDTLGWKISSQWGDAESGRGATLQWGALQVALAERHTDDLSDASNRAIQGVRPSLYFAVDDLEAHYQSLPDKSIVLIAPEKTHWGVHWFVVRDPDGNIIAFTQRNYK